MRLMGIPNETGNNKSYAFLEVNIMLLQCDSLICGDMNLVNWILQYDEYSDVIGFVEFL